MFLYPYPEISFFVLCFFKHITVHIFMTARVIPYLYTEPFPIFAKVVPTGESSLLSAYWTKCRNGNTCGIIGPSITSKETVSIHDGYRHYILLCFFHCSCFS